MEESPVLIVEEPVPQKTMASEVEVTLPTASLEGITPVAAAVELEGPATDSVEEPVQLSTFPVIMEGNFR